MHIHIQKAGFLEQKINKNSATNPTDNLPRLPAAGAIRVVEMFSGLGGIGIALNRTRTDKHHFEHVWATDYDGDTMRTYKANVLKGTDVPFFLSGVRILDIDSLPVADGFLYGFPCNDFSLVGESKGLDGHFGGLFSYGVRYINRVNPLFFLAENVTGLSSANEGRAFETILASLIRVQHLRPPLQV